MSFTSIDIKNSTTDVHHPFTQETEEYSEILDFFELPYKKTDYYLQVGEITRVQGWILHISVVMTQMIDLFAAVIPFLLKNKLVFKIVSDRHTGANMLHGNFGFTNIGKIISIYPESDQQARQVAKELITLTAAFKGPVIPTDLRLGKVIYTRYGSFNPVLKRDTDGNEKKYVYNAKGELIPDDYRTPFKMPEGISWPFSELASPIIPKSPKILNKIYRPLTQLKSDFKGNVSKGIYLKGFLKVKSCVIKEGNECVLSDIYGRDIHDRLAWQNEIHKDLAGIVPVPAIYNFFTEDGRTFLVMEYIDGISLYEKVKQTHFGYKSWLELGVPQKSEILGYIQQIIDILACLHEKGYVHRDIVPGNFLIDSKGRINLIDLELSYSWRKSKPYPAYSYGTYGFMSPEQQSELIPTVKEDIYALGALIMSLLVGLSPTRINTSDREGLFKSLSFFTGDKNIPAMLCTCLSGKPSERPSIEHIRLMVDQYKNLLEPSRPEGEVSFPVCDKDAILLNEVISAAIKGLSKEPIVQLNDTWYSKYDTVETPGAFIQQDYIRSIGVFQGLSGPLYLLARAQKMGFDIRSCARHYEKGWEFIEETSINKESEILPGLYSGAAGIALSMTEGIRAGLLEDNERNKEKIQLLLSLMPRGLNVAVGLAGQGVALMQCRQFLDPAFLDARLTEVVGALLNAQQKDGSWIIPENVPVQQRNNCSFGYGISGIIWFLLEYRGLYGEPKVDAAITKSLHWILKRTHDLKDLFSIKAADNIIIPGNEKGDERKGILLTFIKAYEVTGNKPFKELVERELSRYPSLAIKNDFTQDSGLAGLGEVYLEAWRVFNTPEWEKRANWIVAVFLHTFYRRSDGTGYWILEERNDPTADFMIGCSGIIHLLLRSLAPETIGYRLMK